MPPRFKNFGTPASSDEPIIFQLYGQEFKCRSAIQGRTLIDLVARADQNNMAAAAGAILEFMDRVLDDDSRERFQAMTNSEDHIVDMALLSDIMEWLIGQYAGRPTEPPSSDSSDGPTITGLPVPDGQYSPVSSSSTLTPVASST